MITVGLEEYSFNPTVTTADARVLGFPMPGGAIGPNVHMMVKAGILNKYSEVLAEFPVVVEAGGAWTSVTPGSQQYWLQAFNNVMYGRWEKIDPGYGRAVLGYFGKTPLAPDQNVIKIAAEQLDLPVFEGDPLEAAPNNIEPAKKALEEYKIPVTESNTFLVLASMVPGKKIEINEGIRLLTGKGKIDIPLKKVEKSESKPVPMQQSEQKSVISSPIQSKCTIEENGKSRTFIVTVEPLAQQKADLKPADTPKTSDGEPVYSTFAGSVDVVDVLVKEGDPVTKGQVIAQVEAMKAKHDIKAPKDGIISAILVEIGDEIDSSKPIMTIS